MKNAMQVAETLHDMLVRYVTENPGHKASSIAKALKHKLETIGSYCSYLYFQGEIGRCGRGGKRSPYRYGPISDKYPKCNLMKEARKQEGAVEKSHLDDPEYWKAQYRVLGRDYALALDTLGREIGEQLMRIPLGTVISCSFKNQGIRHFVPIASGKYMFTDEVGFSEMKKCFLGTPPMKE